VDKDQRDHLTQIQAKYVDDLMRLPNVVGVGIGQAQVNDTYTDTPAIVVMVERKVPADQLDAEARIPRELEGVRVDVQEVGQLNAF
jgi:predicted regulator of amino acid metabolism with ACT domain